MERPKTDHIPDSEKYIGCCGAYCRTCRAFTQGFCRGCKLGYEQGERSIEKARCKIKMCCFRDRKLETCADCADFTSCMIISGLYEKKGYKYGKYKESNEFIRKNGYAAFLKSADTWKGPFGKLLRITK
ncbi:MAG TPA: DUF3795 domain-containing protein [Methanoregula sp.]|nr:DUF3795 domain-containing protein [Methanoregula sp.]